MPEEEIKHKSLIQNYTNAAEKYFPPDWSYAKNALFENYVPKIILDYVPILKDANLNQEQLKFILPKVCNWCAWCYIDAEILFLDDQNVEKMFYSLITNLIKSFLNCITKDHSLEECDAILDEIAKDNFTKFLEMLLSKGVINKRQMFNAMRRNAKELSGVNIEFNNENNQNLSIILAVGSLFFIIIPTAIAWIMKISIFKTLAVSIILAILCYWLYMTILNWRVKKNQIDLLILRGNANGINPAAINSGATTTPSKKDGQGNVNKTCCAPTANCGKETTGLVSARGIRSLVLLKLGKNLMPYSTGYTEGQLPVLVGRLRNKLIKKYKFELPPIELKEDGQLGDNEYRIIVRRSKIYEDYKGTIVFNRNKDSESPMEALIAQIEKCVERHINNLKGWSFADGTRPEDFENDL